MPQEWTKEEVLKLRKEVEKMKESEREKFLEGWSAEHYGQEFGHWPLFPVNHIGTPSTRILALAIYSSLNE